MPVLRALIVAVCWPAMSSFLSESCRGVMAIKSRVRRAQLGESERESERVGAGRILFMNLIICSLDTVWMRG